MGLSVESAIPHTLYLPVSGVVNWWHAANIAALLLFAIPAVVVIYNYYFHPLANFKGPFLAKVSPLWLMGSINRHRHYTEIEALHRKYGPVVRIGPNELSFASKDAIKDIHNPGPEAGHFTKKGTIEELLGQLIWPAPNVLTTQDKAAHKRLRSAIQPAFTAKALLEQQDITQLHVNRAVEEVSDNLRENPSAPFNLTKVLGRMLWGIVGDLAFGEPISLEQLDGYENMKSSYSGGAPLLELAQFIHGFPVVGNLIKVPIALIRKLGGAPTKVLGMSQVKRSISRQSGRKDFLTAILGAQSAADLTDVEIFSNMALLTMVGYDTSVVTLSACFYHLMRHREHYARLQAELRAAYATADDITCASLLRLPWLNACVSETLRLLPPINGRGSHRVSPGATVDGVWVPRGTLVSADPFTTHRDPGSWAHALEYRPERWIDELNGPGTPYERDDRGAWRPFLVGPRVCIGREMALQSIRLSMAKIVHGLDLHMANDDFVWERDVGSNYVWHDFDIWARFGGGEKALV